MQHWRQANRSSHKSGVGICIEAGSSVNGATGENRGSSSNPLQRHPPAAFLLLEWPALRGIGFGSARYEAFETRPTTELLIQDVAFGRCQVTSFLSFCFPYSPSLLLLLKTTLFNCSLYHGASCIPFSLHRIHSFVFTTIPFFRDNNNIQRQHTSSRVF